MARISALLFVDIAFIIKEKLGLVNLLSFLVAKKVFFDLYTSFTPFYS